MAKVVGAVVLLMLLISAMPLGFEAGNLVGKVFDITAMGARGDGKSESSKALLAAWAGACGSKVPATIKVPAGLFLVTRVKFSGPCSNHDITFQMAGTLVAPAYHSAPRKSKSKWIHLDHVEGVSIKSGAIDGRGSSLWACKRAGRHCPFGATSLTLTNSKNVVISGLRSVNSELYHIVIESCKGVTLQGVRISAPRNSPNTDGIHIQRSTDVTVTGSSIQTGDDCISVGPGSSYLWIERVSCGTGHGISIGSLGKTSDEDGVKNVTVRSTVFRRTENGLRIKTWGRPSNGFAYDVAFEHSIMQNVRNPIIIDQNYCPNQKGCPHQSSGVKISNVSYRDIHGSSATPVAVSFDCSSAKPCSGIRLQDISLRYHNKPANSSCSKADGTASGILRPPSCLS